MNKTILIVLLVACFFEKTAAQKGEKSIAAGPIVAIPDRKDYIDYQSYNTGIGAEATGQYNLTGKSAVLLQFQLIHFGGHYYFGSSAYPSDFTSISLKGGYRYQFSPSGFYANFLVGIELNGLYVPATIGIGKRFQVNNHFIDAGIDYTGGYITHYSIKAVYSLLRKTGE